MLSPDFFATFYISFSCIIIGLLVSSSLMPLEVAVAGNRTLLLYMTRLDFDVPPDDGNWRVNESSSSALGNGNFSSSSSSSSLSFSELSASSFLAGSDDSASAHSESMSTESVSSGVSDSASVAEPTASHSASASTDISSGHASSSGSSFTSSSSAPEESSEASNAARGTARSIVTQQRFLSFADLMMLSKESGADGDDSYGSAAVDASEESPQMRELQRIANAGGPFDVYWRQLLQATFVLEDNTTSLPNRPDLDPRPKKVVLSLRQVTEKTLKALMLTEVIIFVILIVSCIVLSVLAAMQLTPFVIWEHIIHAIRAIHIFIVVALLVVLALCAASATRRREYENVANGFYVPELNGLLKVQYQIGSGLSCLIAAFVIGAFAILVLLFSTK